MNNTFAGIKIRNRIFAASSPLTESAIRVECCYNAGFGGVILKSAADHMRTGKGHGRKVVYIGEDFFADASFEQEILTIDEGLELYKKTSHLHDKMLIIPSVSADSLSPEKWKDICRPFAECGADLIQLDFFYLGTLHHDEKFYVQLENLLSELGQDFKIMPKLNFNFDPDSVCRVLKKCGIKQVSLLDSIRFDLPERFGLHKGTTSYFGKKQLPETRRYLKCAKKYDLEICAGGGVANSIDAETLFFEGADTVQIASAVLKHGFIALHDFTHLTTAVTHNPWCDVENGAKCTNCGGCKNRIT